MIQWKWYLKSVGLGVLVAGYLLFLWTFLIAYFSGTYMVLVTINEYHEAHIELALFILTLPVVLWVIWKAGWALREEED